MHAVVSVRGRAISCLGLAVICPDVRSTPSPGVSRRRTPSATVRRRQQLATAIVDHWLPVVSSGGWRWPTYASGGRWQTVPFKED